MSASNPDGLLSSIMVCIDNYIDTIYVMVGFSAMFKFRKDERLNNYEELDDVHIMQGIAFTADSNEIEQSDGNSEASASVSPDITIFNNGHVLFCEAKLTWPKEKKYWGKNINQIDNYESNALLGLKIDKDLIISSSETVLLVHFKHSYEVHSFIESLARDNHDGHTFTLIEVNRVNQAKTAYQYRVYPGSYPKGKSEYFDKDNLEWHKGVLFPIEIILEHSSRVKIYDASPPLPYLMHLIWEHVITVKAFETRKSQRKNRRTDVTITVNDITDELRTYFSFNSLPWIRKARSTPKKSWVRDACNIFVVSGDAEWENQESGIIKFGFKEYEDTLSYCIECAGYTRYSNQLDLF